MMGQTLLPHEEPDFFGNEIGSSELENPPLDHRSHTDLLLSEDLQ